MSMGIFYLGYFWHSLEASAFYWILALVWLVILTSRKKKKKKSLKDNLKSDRNTIL